MNETLLRFFINFLTPLNKLKLFNNYSGNNENQFNLRKTIKKEISKSKQFQRHRSPPKTLNFCYKNNYPVNTENKTDKFNVAGNSQACFLQKYSRVS